MTIYFLVIGLLFAGTITFLLAWMLLIKKGWFTGFVRGLCGTGLLFLTLMIGCSSLNLLQYIGQTESGTIATISFQKIAPQTFNVRIEKVNSSEAINFVVVGDLFQIGVNCLTLPLGRGNTFFQLSFIKTKYYSIEQQESRNNSNFSLEKDSYGANMPDLFTILHQSGFQRSKSTAFHAMSEGELLSLQVLDGDLLLNPINHLLLIKKIN